MSLQSDGAGHVPKPLSREEAYASTGPGQLRACMPKCVAARRLGLDPGGAAKSKRDLAVEPAGPNDRA